jgi:hypothetical protein
VIKLVRQWLEAPGEERDEKSGMGVKRTTANEDNKRVIL